jgi:hypothetical protein
MKRHLIYLFLLIGIYSNAQVKNYYPSADNWEVKTPVSFKMDSAKLNQAIQFAKDNETKFPKNLWLSQAMQYGKEPFSDPIGPMADRGPATGLVIYKGYIVAQWGNPGSVEMTHSVTKSFVSTMVGLAYDKGLIRSIDDKVYAYLPPIQMASENAVNMNANPIAKTSFIYPFETEHNKKISWDHLLRQTSDWEGVLWGKPDWADRSTPESHLKGHP